MKRALGMFEVLMGARWKDLLGWRRVQGLEIDCSFPLVLSWADDGLDWKLVGAGSVRC